MNPPSTIKESPQEEDQQKDEQSTQANKKDTIGSSMMSFNEDMNVTLRNIPKEN